MTVTAGIFGTVIGSELAKFLNRYTRKAEAIVCSVSMLVATPFLYLSLTVVQYKILYVSYVTVFLAILFACLNWTPVSAMLLVSGFTHGENDVFSGLCIMGCWIIMAGIYWITCYSLLWVHGGLAQTFVYQLF